jgi:tRNA(fMet)-specific endonuclease VapC
MKIALDTNRYIDLAHGLPDVMRPVREAEQIILPFTVLAELRSGFLGGNRRLVNEQFLSKFLGNPRTAVAYPDDQTTHHYAALYHQLEKQGTPIPINDIWVAAIVVQHNLILCTRDKHFDHLAQIPRI